MQPRRCLIKALIMSSIGYLVQDEFTIAREPLPSLRVNLVTEIAAIKKHILPKFCYCYQSPQEHQLFVITKIAHSLLEGQERQASFLANSIALSSVKMRDASRLLTLHVILEAPVSKGGHKGWGSYFLNTAPQCSYLIEVPHPLYDRFTLQIATDLFLQTRARGLLIAGAHRHANGINKADVCDLPDSAFQCIHQTWSNSQDCVLQIHGFKQKSKQGFPELTDIVLSSGQTLPSSLVSHLCQKLTSRGWAAFVFNKLPIEHLINQKINRGIAGITFRQLGGIRNVQAQWSKLHHCPFIHCEISDRLRNDPKHRKRFVHDLAQALATTPPFLINDHFSLRRKN